MNPIHPLPAADDDDDDDDDDCSGSGDKHAEERARLQKDVTELKEQGRTTIGWEPCRGAFILKALF